MAIDLNDKTANGNTLTNNGAAEVAGAFAASTVAVDLEAGDSDNLTAEDSVSLSQTGDMTLECWINFESTPASGNVVGILTKNNPGSAQRSYFLGMINDAGTLKVQAQIDQDGDTVTRDTYRWNWTPSADTWYHLALTITPGNASASTFELYIDASSQGNGTAVHTGNAASIFNGTAKFKIGQNDDNSADEYFDGKIDEIRVWSDVRTAQEIDDNKAIELTGGEANLVAYWPFESDSAGVLDLTSKMW